MLVVVVAEDDCHARSGEDREHSAGLTFILIKQKAHSRVSGVRHPFLSALPCGQCLAEPWALCSTRQCGSGLALLGFLPVVLCWLFLHSHQHAFPLRPTSAEEYVLLLRPPSASALPSSWPNSQRPSPLSLPSASPSTQQNQLCFPRNLLAHTCSCSGCSGDGAGDGGQLMSPLP